MGESAAEPEAKDAVGKYDPLCVGCTSVCWVPSWRWQIKVRAVDSGFGKEKTMATLQESLDIDGVVAAGQFSLDGSLLEYEAQMDMSEMG
jgi:hypothetical protein